ncbi:hypothetical protein KID03_03115 [bacterium]|nr:hypothetical protein [bacterium]
MPYYMVEKVDFYKNERKCRKMGMAASQARLLTITARLNHIELESQNLSNAKIRLSDNTQRASDKYIKALNKTEYLYNTYNAKGEMITQDLTGAALTNYGELKNQYGLINSAGQILVSELDGKNFQESNTLEEFLDKYGVLSEPGKGEIVQVTNPEYAPAMDEYEKLYDEWMTQKPDPEDEKYLTEIPGSTLNSDLYEKFMSATTPCLHDTFELGSNCYMHVLIDLMGPGEHTTSDGQTYTVYPGSGTYGLDMTANARTETMEAVTEAIKNTPCCGNVQDGCGNNHTITVAGKDYTNNECGDAPCNSNETIYQKVVDLYWEARKYFDPEGPMGEGGYREETGGIECYEEFIHILEHDLKQALQKDPEYEFNDELYQADLEEWQAKEPQKPDVPMYVDKEVRKVTDSDKAQWYINLWHRMNGTSDFKGGFGDSAEYDPSEGWASKSKTEQSWAILKDGDMNSPEYLKYAIDNGLITIEQVQFTNPSDSDSGLENVAWTSVIFDTITDVTEQKDQIAITKAETEYEQALSDIEAKDKQLDVQMKKLDTEHNALQTEYDSIKSVIEKNVERNFKIFS